MPIIESEDHKIRGIQGVHLYHHFLSNCAKNMNLVLAEKDVIDTPDPVHLLSRDNISETTTYGSTQKG